MHRQADNKSSAPSLLAFHIYSTFMFSNNSVGNGKSQTCSLTGFLCCKEWFKDVGNILFIYSFACIGYGNPNGVFSLSV